MLAATRLTYRINRFEVRAILIATVLGVVVSAAVVTWLRQSGYADCLMGGRFDGELSVACLGLLDEGQWFERIARASLGLVPFFPFLAGLLLGAPIVARELDRGTARLAWSLSPSRTRWYAHRLLPVLALIGLSALAIGIAAEWLVQLYSPGVDLSRSFAGFHSRGLLVVTSALVIGSVAVFVGSVVGRIMPSLLLALVLGGLTLLGVSEVHKNVMKAETVPLPETAGFSENDLWIDGKFQLPDGRLLTWDEIVAIDPSVMETGPMYPYVSLVIPGNRYRAIEIREAAVHLAIVAILLAAGGAIVARRRPG